MRYYRIRSKSFDDLAWYNIEYTAMNSMELSNFGTMLSNPLVKLHYKSYMQKYTAKKALHAYKIICLSHRKVILRHGKKILLEQAI